MGRIPNCSIIYYKQSISMSFMFLRSCETSRGFGNPILKYLLLHRMRYVEHKVILPFLQSICLFSTVRFQMCTQIACICSCKVTLAAIVGLFPTVCFQMYPQIACLGRCIITQVAFVCLFSTMGFQMCLQITFVRGHIIALVAFVQGFSLFHGNFHILFVYVVIFKSFIHFQFLHSIVLLPMTT